MSQSMQASSLKDVDFWETNNPAICAIQLIDVDNKTFSTAVNSGGIAAFIGKLLGQATHPEFAAASLRRAQIQNCHIDGNRLELKSGRSPTEVAATVTIGCVRLIIFLPLDEVIRACGELVQRIESIPPDKPH